MTRVRRTLAAWVVAASLVGGTASRADELPSASPYLGEIRRGLDGRIVAVPVPASPARADVEGMTRRTLRVGATQDIRTIADAARLAKDGDIVEIDPGEYTRDVAVWRQHDLLIRGAGARPLVIADGASAEGKAIWVIRGGSITVENVAFVGARVADRNGAGIRFEKGDLTLRRCRFTDNENGLLAGAFDGTLTIEDSEFDHNGDGSGQTHNLYVGAIARLSVSGSHFHHANVGHLLKSRARENRIFYNRLTDESGGRASYELEFPNGGINLVVGNVIEQSATTENSTVISMGAEGYKGAPAQLHLVNNTLVDRRASGGRFLAVRPGDATVRAYNNLTLGRAALALGIEGEFVNNIAATQDEFVASERYDFRVRRDSRLHRTFVAPGSANGIDLAQQREYVHPARTRELTGAPTLPGARQTMQPDD